MLKNLLIALVFLVLAVRCSEKISIDETEIGRAFYPLQVGNYWIYDVVETRVSNNQYDSVKYQMRELVDSVFRDAANGVTYRIMMSRKSSNQAKWGNDSLVFLNKSLSDVQRTHNNLRKVKLIFPVTEGKQWDVNAFNVLDADDFTYAAVNQPFTLNGKTYDKTVKVVQGEPNEVVLDDRTEIYAYQVGLVYKNFTVYEYAQAQGVPDQTRVAKGFKQVFKLNSFYVAD